jgi:hypothetical protein
MFITIANFLMYQGAWLAAVMGAGSGKPMLGVAASIMVVAWHLNVAARPEAELRLLVLTALIGGAWETLLVSTHWVQYQGSPTISLPPAWILALWIAFATTVNVSLNWLKGRPWLSALFGLIGGPLAWWAGEQLGALRLTEEIYSLVVIGSGWAILMPLLSSLGAWADSKAARGRQA